jgi:2-polyprenyl-6-methoxyphenol hydroxylase-like FAD-dependent oxidoreductase
MTETPVLIAGGGPVGLTLALELAAQEVECRLVDRRPAMGRLPKMERCNARTMENFRRLGLADAIREAGLPSEVPMDVYVCVDSIQNPPLVHHRYPSVAALKHRARQVNDGTMPLEPYQLISQYTLEPLLRTAAEESPFITVEFGHELVSRRRSGRSTWWAVTVPRAGSARSWASSSGVTPCSSCGKHYSAVMTCSSASRSGRGGTTTWPTNMRRS